MFAAYCVESGLNRVLNQKQVIICIRAELESNVMKTCFVPIIRVGVVNDRE